MSASLLYRGAVVAIILMACLGPVLFWAADRTSQGMVSTPETWIPNDNQEFDEFVAFVNEFEMPDIILVSWDGCTLDDQRLDLFADKLEELDASRAAENSGRLFYGLETGRTLVNFLKDAPLELSTRAAVNRLSGVMFGPAGTPGASIVLTPHGAFERDLAIRLIGEIAEETLQLDRSQFHVGGMPVVGWAVEQESIRALSVLAIPTIVVVILLTLLCLRSWRLTVLVLSTAFFGERLALSLPYFTGVQMNPVLIVLSPLMLVMLVSAGVHVINYVRAAVTASGADDDAALGGLRNAVMPCLLSTLTTMLGLLSLLVSQIIPVRQFAVFAVLALSISTLLVLLVVGGVLQRWRSALEELRRSSRPSGSRLLERLAASVCSYPRLISVTVLLGTAILGFGITRTTTDVGVFGLLDESHPASRDHHWIEANVTPLVSLEVIMRFDRDNELPPLTRARIVRDLHLQMAKTSPIESVVSAVTFLPAIGDAGSVRSIVRRTVLKRRLQRAIPELDELGMLKESESAQSWRITARVPSDADIEYQSFLSDLESQANQAVRKHTDDVDSVRIAVTGLLPVVANSQRALIRDLAASFVAAFLSITIVTMIGLRNVGLGVLAMIPNVFPLAILFGTMGWIGQPLDIGALMTASVALGIAVDDTLHLMLFWKRERADGVDGTTAVRRAVLHCGRPMAQTTLICGFGLLVFALSDFEPTRRFSWMMFTLLQTAIIGDLLLLPALLVLLGKLNDRKRRAPDTAWFGQPAPGSQDAGSQRAGTLKHGTSVP